MIKKAFLGTLLLGHFISSWAQTKFLPGYYIDENGDQIECLVRNSDWQNNPIRFDYKLTENAQVKTGDLESVQEFGVGKYQFQRFSVQLDISTDVVDKMDEDKNPKLTRETLFLRKVVVGEGSLFVYSNRNLVRYFYRVGDGAITALIYKRFRRADGTIGYNNTYRSQLAKDLSCADMNITDLQGVEYRQPDLVEYFIKYNTCKDPNYTHDNRQVRKTRFNLSIRPGVRNSSLLAVSSLPSKRMVDFGDNLGFRVGLEFEVVLPFNNSKWGIVVEPSYQTWEVDNATAVYTFLATGQQDSSGASTSYISIELPMALRYYFFINEKSSIFINAGYIFSFPIEGEIVFEEFDDLEYDTNFNGIFGVGYSYSKKFSIEARYHVNRNVLRGVEFWDSEFNAGEIVIGYNFLGTR